MKRKAFLKRVLGGIVTSVSGLYVFSSCSSGDDATPAQIKSCLEKGAKPFSISSNHGHTLSIPKEDVASGVSKAYNILGTADHGHSVTIAPEDFVKLQNNEQVIVMSTSDNAHTHSITIVCNS